MLRNESYPHELETMTQTMDASYDANDDVPTSMRVKKRSGALEKVNLDKIVKAISRCCSGLSHVDAMRVATRTISGLYDGASTKELDQLSIQTAASLMVEEPEYSKLAARMLSIYIDKEVRGQEIHSFSQSVAEGVKYNLIGSRLANFVKKNSRKLNDAIDPSKDLLFEYFGLRTVYDRYLIKHPETRQVLETPQHFFMRIACALSEKVNDALDLYRILSSLEYLPSSPTLFNAGMAFEQLSSCFLIDSPEDSLESIYEKYAEVAMLSKFAGGIGIAYHRVRSRNSLIRSTNGRSNGIIPWLKTLDSSVSAVNQGGKRKGACCVYLADHHADIEEFLELRDNTGEDARRTYNLNIANWVSDLFMKRVEQDAIWSLFDPKQVPQLNDLYGEAFEKAYLLAEEQGLAIKQMKARDLYAKMMRTLAETGNGWMVFKDRSNSTCNQTGLPKNVVHLSNLCTEIIEVTSNAEIAVCNLGSLNLARYVENNEFNFEKLATNVKIAIRQLDRVIDLNYYPVKNAAASNLKWRPVGLGIMGLQDVFFLLREPFDSEKARDLSKQIQEEIYYNALLASCELAETLGAHSNFSETRAARGELQLDYWPSKPSKPERFEELKKRIQKSGLRNSLLLAIAPTATIASIAGCYECIEPQVSNLFKRETLSGEFLQVNRYLVHDLKKLGLWTESFRSKLKQAEGSIQQFQELPITIRQLYRTAWEIPMRSLIDMAAERGAFIDQSQSLNLFIESPSIGALSSMYYYVWQKGLKTSYYLRSRPATGIAKTTVQAIEQTPVKTYTDSEAIACSLENPEYCEACQ